MDIDHEAVLPLMLAPARAYRELLYRPGGELSRWLGRRFEIVARPGRTLTEPPRLGDVLLTVTLGQSGVGACGVLTDARLTRRRSGRRAAPGFYCTVTGATFARRRRLLDLFGRVPPGQVLLRLRPMTADSAPSPLPSVETLDLSAPDLDAELSDLELSHGDEAWAGEAATCIPAAEPGTAGGAPHPVIRKGSRRPAVGYAQECLNEFLVRHQGGSVVCPVDTPAIRDFMSRTLAALKADNQMPLVVDCQFGTNTDRAVKMLQACFGLERDGVTGKNTWPVLKTFDPRGAAPVATAFRLLLDVCRDGTLAPAGAGWMWGSAGQGAVVLVNNDDDGAVGQPDNDNSVIGTGNDRSELAPLVIECTGPLTPGTTLELEVSDPKSIRVFGGLGAGSAEIIGPGKGARHRFVNASPSRIEMSMEGIRYARRGFSGEVTLTMRATPPGGPADVQTATVRMAPWMIPSHLDAAERVYVVDAGSDNNRFRTDLRRLVAAAGCHLVEISQPNDIWMQDCMEFGFSSVPSKALRTVFRAPRPRPLQTVPRSLLGADLGYTEDGTMGIATTFDSTGNLEASPPVSSAGKAYPMGRIYFGSGAPSEEFDPLVRDFLEGQVVQRPIALDTNWLAVGHVDEVITFVPAPGTKGFRLLLASPRRAYAILDRLAVSNGSAKMLVGRSLRREHPTPGRVPVERSVTNFLALPDDFNPELRHLVSNGMVSHASTSLRRYNEQRQADVDRIRARLVTDLGLTNADIIDLPAVFMPNPVMPSTADALIPGMVNMLVVNGHCIVPKPFGPVIGGDDHFEKDVRDQLVPLGLTVSFLDCWEEYHVLLGEVHCATNTLRRASAVKWWEFTP